ncbi:MAG: 4'-phosphopantetheinyl transferase superfamily protein [Prevotella sp.]|nr:4'-phosphopantetheinyl transferase superfamily protein [Prevotella sp.]
MIYIDDRLDLFDLDAALPLLSEERRMKVMRYRGELNRKCSAAAYVLLRRALKEEYGIEEKPIFTLGEHGKPYIVGHEDIHFNLSHCREAVACVIDRQSVGIDIETVGRYKENVARHTMNDAEMEEILSAEHPEMAFTRLWTRKEAMVKLTGEGLHNDMKNILDGSADIETVVSTDGRYVYSVARRRNGGTD